ncbi:beta-propeller domain-containing protein, partial [Streptosporangium fragile]|uniref:beta-propeller domain-containing protein n=1 Tax=Streptosporangium fragile TaxID=46186 RepID=UPI0031ED804B
MMASIRTVGAVTLAALLATACSSTEAKSSAGRTAPVELGNVKLVSYSGCDDMLAGLRAATAKNVDSLGMIGPSRILIDDVAEARSAFNSSPEHSPTNTHETGVDEPDLVKTDGDRVITVDRGVLRVVDTATRKVTGTLKLLSAEQVFFPATNLLVSGDRALVLFSDGGVIPFGGVAERRESMDPHYVLVDLSGQPKVIGSLTPDGSHVGARMVGSTVRIVVRSWPQIDFPRIDFDVAENERTRRNKEIVGAAPIEAWLPKYGLTSANGVTSERTVDCGQVSHPAEYTGTSMLTVHTIDLSQSLAGTTPISVAADGDTVYGTGAGLYVTNNPYRWARSIEPAIAGEAPPATPEIASPPATAAPDPDPTPPLLPDPAPTPTDAPSPTATPEEPAGETEVHRFDITAPGAPRYV